MEAFLLSQEKSDLEDSLRAVWAWSGSRGNVAEGLIIYSSARPFVNATAEFPPFVQPSPDEQVGEAWVNRRRVCSEQTSFRSLQKTTSNLRKALKHLSTGFFWLQYRCVLLLGILPGEDERDGDCLCPMVTWDGGT